jgi:hypothetical protein
MRTSFIPLDFSKGSLILLKMSSVPAAPAPTLISRATANDGRVSAIRTAMPIAH